jgi:hypothetical protein
VNFSADDDNRVMIELMVPHFEYLSMINQCLTLYASGECFDEIIVHNVIWFFGNMLGDRSPDFYCAVIEHTDFVAFVSSIVQ